MILISSSKQDDSTTEVISWIKAKSRTVNVVRIDDDSDYTISFDGKDIFLHHGYQQQLKVSDVQAYWHRRGRIRYKFPGDTAPYKQDEQNTLEQYLEHLLLETKSLGNFQKSNPNKLVVLQQAAKVGLEIPEQFFFERIKDMSGFESGDLITKNFTQQSLFDLEDDTLVIYTNDVEINPADESEFSPSFFQKKIVKLFELRVFYLKGKFWSMAIFSQADKQTQTDFRRYNVKKPNKTVPFTLPPVIEEKLHKLMLNLGLTTGSIDLIVSDENKYVFLEVNPVGQFGMVSYPCNYNIEEEIANYLIDEN